MFRLTKQCFESFPGLNNTMYCFLMIPSHKDPPGFDQDILPVKKTKQLLRFLKQTNLPKEFALELESWNFQHKIQIELEQRQGECSQARGQEIACNPAIRKPPVQKLAEKQPTKKQPPAMQSPTMQSPEKKPAGKQPAAKSQTAQQPAEAQPAEKPLGEKKSAVQNTLTNGASRGHSHLSTGHLHQLQVRLGYFFEDIELLHKACHDPSSGEWNNNRLALLGDEVLDVIVLRDAIQSSSVADGSKSDKSGLKSIQQQGISRKECALTAVAMGLEAFVRCGGSRHPSDAMLAEAYEAIIGAIFEDGSFDAASAFWKRMQPKVNRLKVLAMPVDRDKHAL